MYGGGGRSPNNVHKDAVRPKLLPGGNSKKQSSIGPRSVHEARLGKHVSRHQGCVTLLQLALGAGGNLMQACKVYSVSPAHMSDGGVVTQMDNLPSDGVVSHPLQANLFCSDKNFP